MSSYIEVIKIALLTFPFLAFFISFPFILINYHKYGSISSMKVIIIYTFILYLLCAYFLIILPLPKYEVVAMLKSPRTQLIPFNFVKDLIRESPFRLANVHTYVKAIKHSTFYVPLYNIFLTVPFGMYLRYYFKKSKLDIIIYSFFLSLFFELTQLTGLYFIYPRGYRLFDVDDLILNTVGGLLGYFLVKPLMKILPTREEIDNNALKKGEKMSNLRKVTSFCLDLFIFGILELILYILFNNYVIIISFFIIYYFLLPFLLKGSTIAQRYLNIGVVNNDNNYTLIYSFLRRLLFCLFYIFSFIIIYNININSTLKGILYIIDFLYFIISTFKYIFTKKTLLFEKLSKTKLISTIKSN